MAGALPQFILDSLARCERLTAEYRADTQASAPAPATRARPNSAIDGTEHGYPPIVAGAFRRWEDVHDSPVFRRVSRDNIKGGQHFLDVIAVEVAYGLNLAAAVLFAVEGKMWCTKSGAGATRRQAVVLELRTFCIIGEEFRATCEWVDGQVSHAVQGTRAAARAAAEVLASVRQEAENAMAVLSQAAPDSMSTRTKEERLARRLARHTYRIALNMRIAQTRRLFAETAALRVPSTFPGRLYAWHIFIRTLLVDIRAGTPYDRANFDGVDEVCRNLGITPMPTAPWERNLERLYVFADQHGHSYPPPAHPLHAWVAGQLKQRSRLFGPRRAALEDLYGAVLPSEKMWQTSVRLAALKAFFEAHGTFDIPDTPETDWLYAWLKKVRFRMRKGKANPAVAKQLTRLGCALTTPSQKDKAFEAYAAAVASKTPLTPAQRRWARDWRRRIRMNEVDQETRTRLASLGIVG